MKKRCITAYMQYWKQWSDKDMIIKEADIKKFGGLENRKIQFSPGVNVIYGENEKGKTTLQQFLKAMLFGMEKKRGKMSASNPYMKYEPWDTPSYFAGSLLFETGGKEFYLERNFYHKENSARLVNTKDLEELSVEQGDLQMLLGGVSAAAYENTFCVFQEQKGPGKDLYEMIRDEKSNFSATGDGSFQLSRALALLGEEQKKTEKKQKELEQEREKKRKELAVKEEMLGEEIRQQQEKLCEKKAEMELCRKNILEKKVVLPERRQSEDTEQESGMLHEKRQWNPLIVAGIVCFLLNHLLRDVLKLPTGVWFLFQCVFALMAVWGIVMTARRKHGEQAERIRKEQARREENRRKAQAEAGADDARANLQSLKGAAAAIEETLQEKEIQRENIQQQKGEYDQPGTEEKELMQKTEAARLAWGILGNLAGGLRDEKDDLLNEQMSSILSCITGGKYDHVLLDEKKGVQNVVRMSSRNPECYSEATMQQIYFAFRMAAGRMLIREEPLPFLLDEAFSGYDEKRLTNVLKWLGGEENQILIFTCRHLEGEILRKEGIAFSEIRL